MKVISGDNNALSGYGTERYGSLRQNYDGEFQKQTPLRVRCVNIVFIQSTIFTDVASDWLLNKNTVMRGKSNF